MTMTGQVFRHLDSLIERYPNLSVIQNDIKRAYLVLEKSYSDGGKLLVAGNGGSASDSEHIVGELMKSFKLQRPIGEDLKNKLSEIDYARGKKIAEILERPLPAISLTTHEALSTAYINDIGDEGIFAQQLLGYGSRGDVFLAISTSGCSQNIIDAAVLAKALEIEVVALTGRGGGELSDIADVSVIVPEKETYLIQEYHLPIYHCWCIMLEERFFG